MLRERGGGKILAEKANKCGENNLSTVPNFTKMIDVTKF